MIGFPYLTIRWRNQPRRTITTTTWRQLQCHNDDDGWDWDER